MTALQGLRAEGIQPGDHVVIIGASGGVGTFATYSPAAVRKVLTPHGTLIQSFGDGSRWFGPVGNLIKAVALNALAGQTLKSFTAKVPAQALKEVSDLIESGRITPVIDPDLPAHRRGSRRGTR